MARCRSVLLVEDHLYTRRMLRERLLNAHYEVTDTASAEHALQLFLTGGIDLILTDLHLAGRSGCALAAAIRRSGGKGATVPILAMTAGLLRETPLRCQHSGITALIPKPFTLQTFEKTAERLCEQAYDAERM